jgi:heme o synthase
VVTKLIDVDNIEKKSIDEKQNENKKNTPSTNTKNTNETIDKSKPIDTIDLSNNSKRDEIGFATQTLLENGWREVRVDYKSLLSNYAKLSKRNLTGLVVTTTMMGCIMAPVPFDAYIFGLTTLGTMLTSASANAYNQFLEVPYDSQMNRTKDRVLVRGHITPLHGFTFATTSGILGLSILFFCVNPLTAGLGLSTLLLYTLIYTPIKRLSALNTWIGSVVGAIPPLMGYTAMVGEIEPGKFYIISLLVINFGVLKFFFFLYKSKSFTCCNFIFMAISAF